VRKIKARKGAQYLLGIASAVEDGTCTRSTKRYRQWRLTLCMLTAAIIFMVPSTAVNARTLFLRCRYYVGGEGDIRIDLRRSNAVFADPYLNGSMVTRLRCSVAVTEGGTQRQALAGGYTATQ
jgi:hypothetical protein